FACIGTLLTALKPTMTLAARLDPGPERRQVDAQQILPREAGVVVVAPAGGRAIGDEVLEAGGDAARRADPLALEATGHGDGDAAGQQRILARALGNPSPARIARD